MSRKTAIVSYSASIGLSQTELGEKGMVQYKLSWLSFKVSSIFAVGKSCLCLFQCQCFPLNGLLCWHLSLLTCMPHAVYIFPKHSPK